MMDTQKRNTSYTFFFQWWGQNNTSVLLKLITFSKQVQYSLRDEDFNYNHDMEDSSEGEENMDGDVFED